MPTKECKPFDEVLGPWNKFVYAAMWNILIYMDRRLSKSGTIPKKRKKDRFVLLVACVILSYPFQLFDLTNWFSLLAARLGSFWLLLALVCLLWKLAFFVVVDVGAILILLSLLRLLLPMLLPLCLFHIFWPHVRKYLFTSSHTSTSLVSPSVGSVFTAAALPPII